MNQAEPRTPRNHAQHELDGFKSQIPIRTPRRTRRASPNKNTGSNNGQSSPRTPGRREQHRDAPQQLRINVQPAAPAPPAPASLSPSVSVLLQSVEKVFSVYEDRSRMARHDVQKVLTDLLVKEQQQKEKWYFLFVKMMKERDVFRQRVEVLESAVAAASRAVKREREEEEEGKMGFAAAAAAAGEKAESKSRSSSPRPIRPLRAVSPTSFSLSNPSLFPVHSPVHSPFSTPPCSTPPPSNSTSSYGTAPPLSACSTSSSSSESASSSSSERRDSISHTSSMHEYSDSDPEDLPKVKRRKSCDDGTSSISSNHSRGFGLPGHDKFLIYRTLDATALPSTQSYSRPVLSARTGTAATVAPSTEFSHVDIMYTRIDNRLVCRACLLEASKSKRISPPPPQSGSSPSDSEENKTKYSSSSSKATSFPPTASWDSLRDHCVKMHPRECEDVGRLHPAELFELRKRLNLPA
ncbi:hypothetical protein CPC08DRAFT_709817 [Agrocybe pediades]|nr:hypothetical protein CPC08DRAFT_709817 [Agrocybe pediades]